MYLEGTVSRLIDSNLGPILKWNLAWFFTTLILSILMADVIFLTKQKALRTSVVYISLVIFYIWSGPTPSQAI